MFTDISEVQQAPTRRYHPQDGHLVYDILKASIKTFIIATQDSEEIN
jgi:hypothetical protein